MIVVILVGLVLSAVGAWLGLGWPKQSAAQLPGAVLPLLVVVSLLQPWMSLIGARLALGKQHAIPSSLHLAIEMWNCLLRFGPTAAALWLGALWYLKRPDLAPILIFSGLVVIIALAMRRRWLASALLAVTPIDPQWRLKRAAVAFDQKLWNLAKVETHFYPTGLLINLAAVALLALPVVMLLNGKLRLQAPLPWLAYCLLFGPALHAWMHSLAHRALGQLPNNGATSFASSIAEAFASDDTTEPQPLIAAANTIAPDAELQRAVVIGDVSLVQFWLAQGANANAEPDLSAADQRKPLVLACGTGQLAIVKSLIASGADVNQVSRSITPLLAATRDSWTGRFDVVMALLTNGADVNASDEQGATALHGAARSRDTALVQLLIDNGADLNAIDQAGYTPMARAVESNNAPVVMALYKTGAKLHLDQSISLFKAAASAERIDTEIIKLLRQKCDIHARDAKQRTALHDCAEHDAAELAEALLAAGAEIEAIDQDRRTPLLSAAFAGSARMLRRLVFSKPDVQQRDAAGNSALHLAVLGSHHSPEVIQLLHAMGCNADLRNAAGKRAADLAMLAGRWDLARMLSNEQNLPDDLDDALLSATAMQNASASAGTSTSGNTGSGPDRNALLISAAKERRLSLVRALLRVGSVAAPVLSQVIAELAEEMMDGPEAQADTWLEDFQAAGLRLGTLEAEPLLCTLARLAPPPIAAIEYFLRKGASVRADSEGDTALILLSGYAAELEGEQAPMQTPPASTLLAALLQAGTDANHRNNEQRIALSYALQWCDRETITLLLEYSKELHQHDVDGETLLLRLIARTDLDRLATAKDLLRAGCDPALAARDGRTPRAAALAAGDAELAELLNITPGAASGRALVNADVARAAANRDFAGLRRLIALGLDANATDADGLTASSHAAGAGDEEMLRFLIGSGADVNLGARMTPLIAAVRSRHVAVIRQLVAAGALVDRCPDGVLTAMNLAAGVLDRDTLGLLIELGGDVNGKRAKPAPHSTIPLPRMAPIHACLHAVLAGADTQLAAEIIELLVRHRADIDLLDANARAPLMMLVGCNQERFAADQAEHALPMVQLLIRLGANVQVRDDHQRGVLHWCCKHGLFDSASALLDAGADPKLVDEFRKLPSDMASALNRHDFNAMFRS